MEKKSKIKNNRRSVRTSRPELALKIGICGVVRLYYSIGPRQDTVELLLVPEPKGEEAFAAVGYFEP